MVLQFSAVVVVVGVAVAAAVVAVAAVVAAVVADVGVANSTWTLRTY